MRLTRMLDRLAWSMSLAIGVAIGVMIAFWAVIDRTLPARIVSKTLLTPEVVAGDMRNPIRIGYVIDRQKTCTTRIERYMIDSSETRIPLRGDYWTVPPSPIGFSRYVVPIPVPDVAKPGKAKLYVSSTYICNPLQNWWPVQSIAEPLEFMVLPPRDRQ